MRTRAPALVGSLLSLAFGCAPAPSSDDAGDAADGSTSADAGESSEEASSGPEDPGTSSSGGSGSTSTSDSTSTSGAGTTTGGTTTSTGSTTGSTITSTDDGASDESDTSQDPPDPPAVTWPLINGIQWADVDGQPIQAHGGGMLKVGDDYYWFGENRNPDGTFYAVSAYRSRDLRRWEHAHDILTMMSDADLRPANVERPKVVYNASTQKYVMWMHWENGRDYGEARAAIASSDTVDGDYTYHGSFRPLQDTGVVDHGKPGYMSRDCTLFVDDDGTGYFLSTANENYDLHLYRLTPDYLAIERREALLFEGDHREAPALFKRGDIYFLVTSGSTGWSPNQARYATSRSLASGWSSLQNVADGNTFWSQSTYVQPIEGPQGTEYLYMGDRWAGAWGGRVNDSAYVWQQITFPTETTMSMTWANTLDVDVAAGTLEGAVVGFVFVNKKSGLAMSVQGSPSENGADVMQDALAAQASPVWRLNYDGAGSFHLTNAASDKVLDVPDESTDPGIAVHLWSNNDGDHQAWRLIDVGEGEYRVRNKKSGLDLGVAGGATEAGARVEQQTPTEGDEQIWRVDIANGG